MLRTHLESGSGLLLVTGEAGIGKTRLVATAQRCTPDVLVLQGRCLPLSTEAPLLPVADVLGAAWRSDGGTLLTAALTSCPSYVGRSLARLLPELEEAPADDGSDRQRLFPAVSEVLSAMASVRPLALVVEDLHWADAATLDLVEHLVASGSSEPPLVGTYRVEDPATPASVAEWRLRLQRDASVTALDVAALSRDETARQIQLLTGTAAEPDLADRIHERSRGHPLFTEQLVSSEGGDLPRLLADLLDQRIGELDGAPWSVATALAVLDRPIEEATVGAVADLPSAELVAGLHELRGRRLADVAPDGEVALRHPLLGEAIRRRLTTTEAVASHRRAAVALSTDVGMAAEIAEHWRRAGDSSRELEWTARAAREADDRFASAESANLWERVLALWPADQEVIDVVGDLAVRRVEAYAGALRALKHDARTERAVILAEEAEAHLGTLDQLEPAASAGLLFWIADCSVDPGKFEKAVDRAVDVLRTLPPSERLVDALIFRAGYLSFREEYAAALEVMREALATLELMGPPRPLTRGVLATIADFEASTGDFESALRTSARASALEMPVPDPGRDAFAAMEHTVTLLLLARPATEVEAVASDVLQPPRHWQFRGGAVGCTVGNVAEAWLRAGDPARAEAVLAGVGTAEPSYDGWPLVKARADVDIVMGRFDAASATLDTLSDLPWTVGVPDIVRSRAELALWRGDPLEAVQLLAPLLVDSDDACANQATSVIPSTTLELGTVGRLLVLLARAAADVAAAAPGRRVELQETIRDAAKHHSGVFDPGGFPSDLAANGQFEAEQARLHKKATVDLWVRAARKWDGVQRPHDAAYCRWRAAQLALKSGHGTVATKLLRRAAHDGTQHVPLAASIAATHRD